MPPRDHAVTLLITWQNVFFKWGAFAWPILGDPGADSRAEERRDENFQARAEEPLGTDSQRTISKRSIKCWLLIGHKKCFVLLYPIGEEFLLSSFRESVHDGYCLSRLTDSFTKLVHARETFIFYFPNQKRRNYWWVEKTFRMLSAGAIQFAQESQKSNSLAWQNKIKKNKKNIILLYISLPSLHDYHVNMPNFTLYNTSLWRT